MTKRNQTQTCHPEFISGSNDSKTLNQVQGDTIVNNHSTFQLFNRSTAKQFAFTLAEVLITITIIGVVAALTIPNLLRDVNQRKYNSMSGNFQRKLGEAINIMNAQNNLKGYRTTKAFVEELGKNFKILKVCDTVTDCFPSEFLTASDKRIETSTLNNAIALGQSYGTETIGVQFVNGVRAIIAYNPRYTMQRNGDAVSFDKDDTNKTVEMNTNVISMIFDVSEDDNNKIGEDIFIKNISLGGTDSEVVQVGPYKIKIIGTDYEAVNCSSTTNTAETLKYCNSNTGDTDFWAGARKVCAEQSMTLPDKDKLKEIYDEGKISGGTPRTGTYWSSSENSAHCAYLLDFSSGNTYYLYESNQHGVLCLGN